MCLGKEKEKGKGKGKKKIKSNLTSPELATRIDALTPTQIMFFFIKIIIKNKNKKKIKNGI